MLPESFGTLTQLRVLELNRLPSASLPPMFALPCLERLHLIIDDRGREPASLPLQSRYLTELKIHVGKAQSVSPTNLLLEPVGNSISNLAETSTKWTYHAVILRYECV